MGMSTMQFSAVRLPVNRSWLFELIYCAALLQQEADLEDDEGAGSRPANTAAAGDSEAGPGPGSDREVVLGESRKDPLLRRRELLGAGKDSVGGALVAEVCGRAGELIRSQLGGDVLVEVVRGGAGGVLWGSQEQGVRAVHEALVGEVAEKRSSSSHAAAGAEGGGGQKKGKKRKGAVPAADGEGGEEQQQEQDHVLVSYFGSRALRRLVLASCEEGEGGEGAKAFVELMWKKGLQGQCSSWVGTHADKVLAALVHCGVGEVAAAAAEELGPLVGGDAGAWSERFMGPPGKGGDREQKQVKQTKQDQQQQKSSSKTGKQQVTGAAKK